VNFLVYSTVVVVWGSTWLAIAHQVGEVSAAASVCYRSAAAAVLLFLYLWARRAQFRYGWRDHVSMAFIGASMFSCNYLFLYAAESRIASGLVALIFALTLPLNVILSAVVLRRHIGVRVLLAMVIGLVGIVMVFWSDLTGVDLGGEATVGILLTLGGTTCFSIGNIVSDHSQRRGVPVVQSEAYGLAYGALLLVPITLLTGGFGFEWTASYLLSLGYLVVFGSIIGFAFYLTILGRIGAERAGYITVLFPIVALLWSTLFEDYTWTVRAAAGALLILAGSALAVSGRPATDAPAELVEQAPDPHRGGPAGKQRRAGPAHDLAG
jgi:drug/metabolite transporter (DMT)-like permease